MSEQERKEARLAANAASKDFAEHDGDLWGQDEVDLLLTWDGTDDELDEMAMLLGRTREACRQKFHLSKRQPQVTVTRTVNTTEKTVTNYYSNWDPADVSPWYK
jgi:hypothetical protein